MKECCKDKDNLVVREQERDRITQVCLVCKSRHLRFAAEPGGFGATMTPLGGKKDG